MSFSALGLAPSLTNAVAAAGYSTPTPIQQQVIPAVLSGRDVLASAQTGTGKTAGFCLPMLQMLAEQVQLNTAADTSNLAKIQKSIHFVGPRGLILVPTRELAIQVGQSLTKYSKGSNLTHTTVFGGVPSGVQIRNLRRGADIVVATPGRLLDLYQQKALSFKDLQMVVLDEADRMLDMGFITDIRRVASYFPKQHQTLMFSATFSGNVRQLANELVKQPLEISVAAENATAENIQQSVYAVNRQDKSAMLSYLIQEQRWFQALVFCRTKHGANRLAEHLNHHGIQSEAFHGNKTQGARSKALNAFAAHRLHVLVATDIAARGLDIAKLPYVVNFDLPLVPEDYVHRIGRTARAGETGEAVSLVSEDEVNLLMAIERMTKQTIERRTLPDFQHSKAVPDLSPRSFSGANRRPKFGGGGPRRDGGAPRAPRAPRPEGGSSWGDRDGGAPRAPRAPRPEGSSWGSRDGAPRPEGGNSWGDRPRAPRPEGGNSWGDRPRAPRPEGGNSWGDRPRAPRPEGGSSWGSRDGAPRTPRAPRPEGGSSWGSRDGAPRAPRAPRPEGGSSWGDRPARAPRPEGSSWGGRDGAPRAPRAPRSGGGGSWAGRSGGGGGNSAPPRAPRAPRAK